MMLRILDKVVRMKMGLMVARLGEMVCASVALLKWKMEMWSGREKKFCLDMESCERIRESLSRERDREREALNFEDLKKEWKQLGFLW